MKKSNLKSLYIFLILLLSHLFSINTAVAYCPPYFAFVDKNVSSYPKCIDINGYMACGGDLEVKSNCSSELILVGRRIPPGKTEYGFKEVNWNYNSIEQKKQKWELKGELNGEAFVVKGQTENWSDKNSLERITQIIPLNVKVTILLFVIGVPLIIFTIKRIKR